LTRRKNQIKSRVPEMPKKPVKTPRQSENQSSFRNNRRCKNTAVCGAGQARTTRCSIFFALRGTILGNSQFSLCKTKIAVLGAGFRANSLATENEKRARPAPYLSSNGHTHQPSEPIPIHNRSQGAAPVQLLWSAVGVVEKTGQNPTPPISPFLAQRFATYSSHQFAETIRHQQLC
jgi:hypothetical protein